LASTTSSGTRASTSGIVVARLTGSSHGHAPNR
jgi:hypothetical protein